MIAHTQNEQEIKDLASQGLSIRAISQKTGISKSRVGRILQKVGVPAKRPAITIKAVKASAVKPAHLSITKTPAVSPKVKYDVHPDMIKYVPQTDGYIPRKIGKSTDVVILKKAYESGQNVLLVGDVGTGKTAVVRHMAYELKLPYARINLNGGTTPDQLVGHFVPDGNGGLKWQDGLLTQFSRHGGIIALDEVNSCPPEILFVLYPLLDDERKLTLVDKDSEVIIAHQNLFIVCTMNPADAGYEGRRPLDAGLKDRFHVKLFYDYDDAIESKLVQNKTMLELARKLRFMRSNGEISTPISLRMLLYYDKNAELYGDKIAFDMFLNGFESHERKPISNVYELILHPEKKEASQNQQGQNGNGTPTI